MRAEATSIVLVKLFPNERVLWVNRCSCEASKEIFLLNLLFCPSASKIYPFTLQWCFHSHRDKGRVFILITALCYLAPGQCLRIMQRVVLKESLSSLVSLDLIPQDAQFFVQTDPEVRPLQSCLLGLIQFYCHFFQFECLIRRQENTVRPFIVSGASETAWNFRSSGNCIVK